MLEAKNLACVRADRRLFAGLSLSVEPGELLHAKGANGAGKTTLLRALCGLFQPDAGEVLWRGEEIGRAGEAFLRELLYIGHQSALKPELTPLENLSVACRLGGMGGGAAAAGAAFTDSLWVALERVGLCGFEDLPCGALSQGQRRRAVLARLWLDDAALWVLDEPFTALDAAACALARDMLARHIGNGGMVVLTAHEKVDLPGGGLKRLDLGARPAL